MTPHPELVSLLAAVSGAVLLASAGVRKRALEWKRARRRCPACGRETDRPGRDCACRDS